MPNFNIEKKRITAFDTGETYIFKIYFDEDQLYQELRTHYNQDKYRYEIPEIDKYKLEQLLDEFFYKLEMIDEFERYCVVIKKEVDSSNILRNSVMRKLREEYEILSMKDQLSISQAVENGGADTKIPSSKGGLSMETSLTVTGASDKQQRDSRKLKYLAVRGY